MPINPNVSPIAPTASLKGIANPWRATADPLKLFQQVDLGTKLQGTIISLLKDGTSIVKVNDSYLRMELPAQLPPGTNISLKLLTKQPNITFLIETSTYLKSNDQKIFTGKILENVIKNPNLTISLGAQVLTEAISNSELKSANPILIGKTPVIPSTPANTEKLAFALQDTISSSGLFYESHLHKWVRNDRPLILIQQEAASLIPQLWEQPNSKDPVNIQKETLLPISTELIPAQIKALEQQTIEWKGHIWPNQEMEWKIEKDYKKEDEDSPTQEQNQLWKSTIKINLPNIGEIQAVINLSGNQVMFSIKTSKDQSEQSLKSHVEKLSLAMDASGLLLTNININSDIEAK